MMSNESNDGARHHWKPTADFDQLMVTYPVAAAYVKGEALSRTAHHVKVILALDAMESIINGVDHNEALAEMQAT
jgi:hypothetical protein